MTAEWLVVLLVLAWGFRELRRMEDATVELRRVADELEATAAWCGSMHYQAQELTRAVVEAGGQLENIDGNLLRLQETMDGPRAQRLEYSVESVRFHLGDIAGGIQRMAERDR